MRKRVLIKKVVGNVVITDKNTYTISKFARNIPELKEGCIYDIEVDDRDFLYEAILVDNNEIKNNIKGLIIIDFETSGTDPNKHYPLSIGLIKTDNSLNIEDIYYSKIYTPEHEYESKALEINNLKLQDGKQPELVVTELNNIVENNWRNYRLAGWNINFDFMFLKRLYSLVNAELDISYNTIDIQTLFSHYYYKQTGKWEIKGMREAYKYLFNFELNKQHNAIEDCFYELEILRKII